MLELMLLVRGEVHRGLVGNKEKKENGTQLIRTPRGHAEVSVLSGCPY